MIFDLCPDTLGPTRFTVTKNLFLIGEEGSGKTWLIEQNLENLLENENAEICIYSPRGDMYIPINTRVHMLCNEDELARLCRVKMDGKECILIVDGLDTILDDDGDTLAALAHYNLEGHQMIVTLREHREMHFYYQLQTVVYLDRPEANNADTKDIDAYIR